MPEKKPQFDIVVCGSASTWPELPPEPCTIAVPVGCTVGDVLEALCYDDPALRSLYPPGALYAKLSGRRCEASWCSARAMCCTFSANATPPARGRWPC